MMETIKAGCILVDISSRKIALVYRNKQKDYSFPKGHKEGKEDIVSCAIRETAEGTKRIAKIVDKFEPYEERYVTPSGEKCVCYMFIAIDVGKSDNSSLDTHDTYWIPFEEVERKLSYVSLQKMWNEMKDKVESLFV